jgi:hypothetical protein
MTVREQFLDDRFHDYCGVVGVYGSSVPLMYPLRG